MQLHSSLYEHLIGELKMIKIDHITLIKEKYNNQCLLFNPLESTGGQCLSDTIVTSG